MSRTPIPFAAADLSALARSLRGQLAGCDHKPSHVELLNMLSRAAGHRNYQHLRASHAADERLLSPPSAPPVDHVRVERAARHFDAEGTLLRWPGRGGLQQLCLWVLWSRIPARQRFSEREISDLLKTLHLFGDHALLRRALCDHGLLVRTPDCRIYRRLEQQPPADAAALIRHLQARFG